MKILLLIDQTLENGFEAGRIILEIIKHHRDFWKPASIIPNSSIEITQQMQSIGPDEVFDTSSVDVVLALTSRKNKNKVQSSDNGIEYSYTFYKESPIVIIIDYENFIRDGPKTVFNAMINPDIERATYLYQQYVILHEIGHAFGLDHVPLNNESWPPVMYQWTIGFKNKKYNFDDLYIKLTDADKNASNIPGFISR